MEGKKKKSSFASAMVKGGLGLLAVGAAAVGGYLYAQESQSEESKIRAELEKRR